MYTTFFDVGDEVYHMSYGKGKIVEVDNTVSPLRYEITFNRYPQKLITVVGDDDMHKLDTSEESVRSGQSETDKKKKENIRQLVDNIFEIYDNDFAKILKKSLDNAKTDKKENTVMANERKLTMDNNGNVIGGAIFGGSTPEIAPTFGTVPASRKSEPDNVARHRKIVMGLNELYARKNADYGDSFHDTYIEEGMAMARIRLSDKLNRFKSLTRNNQQQVKDESIRDTLLDLANYAIMTVIEMDREADVKVEAV